ncbi:recombinase family protein [Halodesulfurarchaeum formicicum]|uniref:Resolvase n=1 Tax=Halodesulfurarchaeum formicicum TaxID=1873524 RepID=A0A1J1AC16_9EURY|nr:recombinase family protein [Halodesulfurarchaeum formicicum]APE95684.1 resolvase [Halodesulfurarchaeum formicicum]
MEKIGLYARVSTSDQDVQRQVNQAREFIEKEYGDIEIATYADVISGATEDGGEEYQRLRDDIEDGNLDAVVVDELSRLSRLGAGEIHQFIQHCLENETGLHDMEVGLDISLDDDLVDQAVTQLIAGVMGDLARVEHKQKLRRIDSGIKNAQEAGKWTGRPPRGFRVENKRLRVDAGEFLAIRDALERIEKGENVREAATDIGVPESTLRRIHNERKELYFYGEAGDERIDEALEGVRPLPEPESGNEESFLKNMSDEEKQEFIDDLAEELLGED